MRYFLEISYDGTLYHGWQSQPNATSVQDELTIALRKLFHQPELTVMGCGRTDSGVHADYFVAHFDIESEIPTDSKTLFKLNSILPHDIAVYSIQHVDSLLHSRFSALNRTYHYRLSLDKEPLTRGYTFRPFFALDFNRMNEAAKILLETSDFTSFSKLGTETKTNICDVTTAHWFEERTGHMTFEILANRFLRNMVRAVVGTLFEVGKGKMTVSQFQDVVNSKNRSSAGTSVAACGLSLVDIEYPEGKGFTPTIARRCVRL